MSLKQISIVVPVCLVGWIGIQFALTAAPAEAPKPPPKTPALQKFMRAKLSLTQGILEGLVTEDFDRINRNSNALLLLTTAGEWTQNDLPLYKQHSEEFRTAIKDLRTMAQKKNLDGAALAYLHATTSCIECHRYVRTPLIAK